MAAEIRDLEDQLYEYDFEYRQLEMKLADIRAENARLREMSPQSPVQKRPPIGLDFLPRTAPPTRDTEPATSPQAVPGTDAQRSILDSSPLNDSDPTLQRSNPLQPVPSNLPERLPTPPSDEEQSPSFDLNDLGVPKIEPGEPMPSSPSIDLLPDITEAQVPSLDSQSVEGSRIELPAQLASHQSAGPAKVTIAKEQVTDRRIVEMAFSPIHCRSVNLDEDDADDGLYLLLQPKNERGQIVPVAAELSIVVLDPAREDNTARIGRWDYTAAEVKAKFEPMGANQGILLTLPWNGPDPSADRVIVFARYTFENGRQVIGQKEIYVATADGYKAVWTPRGPSAENAVRHASAEQ